MSQTGGYKIILEGTKRGTIAQSFFPYINMYILAKEKLGLHPKANEKAVLDAINLMQPDMKKAFAKAIIATMGMNLPCNKFYRAGPQEIYQYTKVPLTIVSSLNQQRPTPFAVDFPTDNIYNFLSSQFIKLHFKKPELVNPAAVPQGMVAKFYYTPRPGIRILEKISGESDTSSFDEYNYLDVLKYDYDEVSENNHFQWNEAIGNDLGTNAEQYIPATDTTVVHKYKVGYQTPKSNPDELVLRIPLLFYFNRDLIDKINMGAFNRKTISYKGMLAASRHIVQAAAFDPNDLTRAPVLLDVKPLEFKKTPLLYSEVATVDDISYTASLGAPASKVYRYTRNDSYDISEVKDQIELKGQGAVTQIALAFRPKSYRDDFFNWDKFSLQEVTCIPTATIIGDPQSMFNIGIGAAKVEESAEILETFDLKAEDVSLLRETDAEIYGNLDIYNKSLRNYDFHIRRTGLYYINFNSFPNTKNVNSMYNMTAFPNPVLYYKLIDSLQTQAQTGTLQVPYELIVYRTIINSHIIDGDAITRTKLQ